MDVYSFEQKFEEKQEVVHPFLGFLILEVQYLFPKYLFFDIFYMP